MFVSLGLIFDSIHIFHVLNEFSIALSLTIDLQWFGNVIQDIIIVSLFFSSSQCAFGDVPLNQRLVGWVNEGLFEGIFELGLSGLIEGLAQGVSIYLLDQGLVSWIHKSLL